MVRAFGQPARKPLTRPDASRIRSRIGLFWFGRPHRNLTTSDVSGLAAFFERLFGFKRFLERGSGAFTILGNDEDFVLTLMKPKKNDPERYPETFHVGFYLDDPAAVRTKHDELADAGLSPGEIQAAERSGRGTHFYCTAPGNVLVEIATPRDRNDSGIVRAERWGVDLAGSASLLILSPVNLKWPWQTLAVLSWQPLTPKAGIGGKYNRGVGGRRLSAK